MGVLLPSTPPPLGSRELRLSLSHLWSKAPSPALPGPTPDILGSAFPWKLGGGGCVRVLSLCVCVTGVCLYISGCVCDSGLCIAVCASPCVYGSVGDGGELGTEGTRVSMYVVPGGSENSLAPVPVCGHMYSRIGFPVSFPNPGA